eukprot:8085100-Alexandrium_andersonii.AAC.1
MLSSPPSELDRADPPGRTHKAARHWALAPAASAGRPASRRRQLCRRGRSHARGSASCLKSLSAGRAGTCSPARPAE